MDKTPSRITGRRFVKLFFFFLVFSSFLPLSSTDYVTYERFNQAFGTYLASPSSSATFLSNSFTSSTTSSSTSTPNKVTIDGENLENFECLNFHHDLRSKNADVWKLFNTKTTYLNARRKLFEKTNITWPVTKNCRPIYLHFLNRHSIRYPSRKYIKEFSEKLPQLRQFIIDTHQHDLSLVRDFVAWKLLMNENDDNLLTPSGRYQSAVTAQIFEQYFPELLNVEQSKLIIGVTPKIRTSQTADAFLRSLVESQLMRRSDNVSTLKSFENFQNLVHEKMSQFQLLKRDVLMSHRHCKSKLEEAHKDIIKKMAKEQMDTLLESSSMKIMLKQFSKRHHFPVTLTTDTLLLMHRICAFEVAIYDFSPWCRLFTDNELKFLTYVLDRQEYHDAYALEPYRQFGCSFVADLINRIDFYLAKPVVERSPEAILDFSHENLLSRIISHFSLYNHCPMINQGSDHVCFPQNREYQSSLLVPFGANFAFILYECSLNIQKDDNKNDYHNTQNAVEHKLLILHNELPIKVDGCTNAFCDLSEFRGRYLRDNNHCDLDKICRL